MSKQTQQLEKFLAVFKQNEHYQNLQWAAQAIAVDEQAQQLISSFEAAQAEFAEAQRFGKYHPDYQTYQRTLFEAKQAVDTYPLLVTYKQAQKQVQALLNQMSIALGTAISAHVVVPSDYFTGQVQSKKCGSNCKCS